MDKRAILIGVILVAALAFFAFKPTTPVITEGASLSVYMNVVEPPVEVEPFAIVTGPKTKVDIETLPFSLTIFNDGGRDFTNVKLGPGTIPDVLNEAFLGLSIESLPSGTSKTLTANVDIASLAPASGSESFTFQAHIIADYDVAGQKFEKSGFSEVMTLTVSPGAGLTVDVTYE